jgi:uncharacterized protein YbjQ (UPF0145 family)
MSQGIVLTTTASVPNREIKEVVDIVSAEVALALFKTRCEICVVRR